MRPDRIATHSRRTASREAARPAAAVLRSATLVATLLAALTSGCAPHRPPAPAPPPAGYSGRVDDLAYPDSLRAAGDLAPFAGRRIAIDPGHGGFFRGSLGVNGLTEAEVNLGVALRLRDLLVAQGAAVLLTRETDRDFLTPADSSLRSDLNARVAMANAFRPDLFVSVHHNADAGGSHAVNETQTYWKLSDDGPSSEAAADVHRSLVRNLGIGANRLLPGNYAVLRGCDAPAILTESSYLTYPPTEALLRTPQAQQLEAEALYLGIAHWCARERPEITRVEVSGEDTTAAGFPPLVRGAGPSLRATVGGAFDAARLWLDGAEQPLERREAELAWAPREPLSPGEHELRLVARLAQGGASRAWTHRFRVAGAAVRVALDAPFQAEGWGDDEAIAVRVRVTDAFGRPVLEPTRVRLSGPRTDGAGRGVSFDTTVTTLDGAAWSYVPRPASTATERTTAPAHVAILRRAALLDPADRVLAADTLRMPGSPGVSRTVLVGFARDARTGEPVANAPGTTGPSPAVTWMNRDGFGRFARTLPAEAGAECVPGWRHVPAEDATGAETLPRFAALFGGALHGRRIAIDPAGNGDVPGVSGADAAGVGPSGTRAADVNLEVARALEAMLRAAGADVLLVRDSRTPVLDVERVRRSEAFRAERYLRIGHGPHAPRLGYYYSSAGGHRWAEHTAAALAALGLPGVAPTEDAQWTLQQTSCAALYASLARIDERTSEARLLAPGAVHREAYALLVGLAREWAPTADWPADSLQVLGAGGRPAAGAAVTLGDALVRTTDARGRIVFLRTEPGAMAVRGETRDGVVRTVVLDAQRGTVLHLGR